MKHHIVAIGISKHKNSNANLNYAEKDASDFFTLFKNNISDIGYNKLLVDSEATLSEIKTALGKELIDQINSEDAFFFYYSGHGATVEDPKDNKSALNYLVPFDATNDIANSCISVEDIKSIFENLPSKANIIFVDSCFSGAITKNSKNFPLPNKKEIKNIKSFSNTVVGNGSISITACKEDEISIEDPEYKNGLFTYYLLEELQKQRKDNDFSAIEIFGPIAQHVTERAKTNWSTTQTPTLLGKLEGDLKLPVFKTNPPLKPDTIEYQKNPELEKMNFTIPIIDLTSEEKDKLINQTINFVINNNIDISVGSVVFERMCHKLFHKTRA
ncbi:MAG: hypothetical protein GQ534_04190, partial [Candidatus Delongbacteria bacterium]|nr:hypothetical protein [Candidatus Delongbacteria bacterium]